MYQSVHKLFISKHHTQCKEAQLLGPIEEIKIIFNPFNYALGSFLTYNDGDSVKKTSMAKFQTYTPQDPHTYWGGMYCAYFALLVRNISMCGF